MSLEYYIMFGILAALISAWMYSNAKDRNDKNAPYWGVVTFFIGVILPLIGIIVMIIIYLIGRKSNVRSKKNR